MGRTLAAAVLVLAAALAGCGGGSGAEGRGPDRSIADDARRTIPIQVDGRPEGFTASFSRYFPDQVTVHPGDTLRFTSVFNGEPHTVTGGTAVDELMAELGRDPKSAVAKDLEAKLPRFFPPIAVQADTPDAEPVQAAAQPCFLNGDDPPLQEACDDGDQEQPEAFTGTQRFFNSGFLEDSKTFDVRLADDIALGTYSFICLMHGTKMRLVVNVVQPDAETPSPEQVAAEAKAQLEGFVAKLRPQVDAVLNNTSLEAHAGAFTDDKSVPAEVIAVVPRRIDAKVGDIVRWTVFGFHTISFNPPPDARPFWAFDANGELHANDRAVDISQSQDHPDYPFGRDPRLEYRDQPVTAEHVVGQNEFAGEGYLNSGVEQLFTADRNQDLVYELKFTTAGTFTYVCLVHPGMEGTVEVR